MRGALFVYATGYIAIEVMLLRRLLIDANFVYEKTGSYSDKLIVQKIKRHIIKKEERLEKVRSRMETPAEAREYRLLKKRGVYGEERIGKLLKV